MFITIVNRFDKFFIKFTKQGKITGMLIPKILRIIFDFSSLQYTQYPVSILFKQVFPVSYCVLLILILRTHLMSHFSLKIRIQENRDWYIQRKKTILDKSQASLCMSSIGMFELVCLSHFVNVYNLEFQIYYS